MKLVALTGLSFGAVLLGLSAVQASPSFTVTITGQKQGKFQGGDLKNNGAIVGLKYDYSVMSPRDLASGQATGKVQHSPITFEKEWDATTPQIYQALVTNENLKSVVFLFKKNESDGRSLDTFRVTLTNASISAIHQHGSDQSAGNSFDEKALEDISLTYQKIEITYLPSGVTAGDDWETTAELSERVPASRKQLASRLTH